MSLSIIGRWAFLGLAVAATLVGCGDGGIANTDDSGTNQGRDSGAGGFVQDDGGTGGGGGGGTTTPDAGAEPTCTGKPGALRGKVLASVTVDGATRTFIYYAPTRIEPNKPVPLVISPHGFAMVAEEMYTMTGFKEVADREGFVAVFPDGNAFAPWNVGLDISGVGAVVDNILANDQGFIDAIIEFAKADQCIDTQHMFVSGFSMGGYFSNENGCLRSDIASIGPHSGGSHDLSQCPGSIKPVIIFHGDADLLITYNENGVLARDRWVARNGCSTEVDTHSVYGGTCDYNRGCPAHGQVALCHFDGMGHTWAGGLGGGRNADLNRESASELAWKFWKQYAW